MTASHARQRTRRRDQAHKTAIFRHRWEHVRGDAARSLSHLQPHPEERDHAAGTGGI